MQRLDIYPHLVFCVLCGSGDNSLSKPLPWNCLTACKESHDGYLPQITYNLYSSKQANSRKLLRNHGKKKKRKKKSILCWYFLLDCFQIKASSDRRALWRVSNPLRQDDSLLQQDTGTAVSHCTPQRGCFLPARRADFSLALPWVGFVRLDGNQSVLCSADLGHKAVFKELYNTNPLLLNWYWVRVLEQNQKIIITIYIPSFHKGQGHV